VRSTNWTLSIGRVCRQEAQLPEFSCAEYSFPLLNRRQALRLLQTLEFAWVDIGLFARNPNYLPSALMEAPLPFTRAVREELAASQLQAADVFLQIGSEPAESSANDPDPAVRARNREVFQRTLEFCVALKCPHLTGLPGVLHHDAQQDFALAAEEAAWRATLCRTASVSYSVEAHIGSICATTATAQQLLNAVPGLTLTLDYGHFLCQGEENAAVHALLPFASHLHARGSAKRRLQTSVAENTIDFAGMMNGLRALDYSGAIALEYVWIDWEGCNRCDNVSETILLREELKKLWADGRIERNTNGN
jgi:sugar phosphate isomerase/epimerase